MTKQLQQQLYAMCYQYQQTTAISKILTYLFENMSESGKVLITQRDLAKQLNLSLETVSTVFMELQSTNSPCVTRVQSGVYKVKLLTEKE